METEYTEQSTQNNNT